MFTLNSAKGAFVVTFTQNHQIIHLFNSIEILNKCKIFQDHRIRKFSNNKDLRKLDFLSPEKFNILFIMPKLFKLFFQSS